MELIEEQISQQLPHTHLCRSGYAIAPPHCYGVRLVRVMQPLMPGLNTVHTPMGEAEQIAPLACKAVLCLVIVATSLVVGYRHATALSYSIASPQKEPTGYLEVVYQTSPWVKQIGGVLDANLAPTGGVFAALGSGRIAAPMQRAVRHLLCSLGLAAGEPSAHGKPSVSSTKPEAAATTMMPAAPSVPLPTVAAERSVPPADFQEPSALLSPAPDSKAHNSFSQQKRVSKL